jgi:hypothetical protein
MDFLSRLRCCWGRKVGAGFGTGAADSQMALALDDCRAQSGGCGFGECAPPVASKETGGAARFGGETDGAWVCRCDAGWTRFPARGAAGMCTVNASLTLVFCAVSAVCALSLLAGSVTSLRAKGCVSPVYAVLIVVCPLCLLADMVHALEPRFVVWADPLVTVLKTASCMLVNDVVVRLTFLRYRTYLLATAWRKTPRSSQPVEQVDVERALLRRTYVEITVVLCVFVTVLCLALSSTSTRITSSIVFAYSAITPAVVAIFIVQSTASVLESLAFISSANQGATTGEVVDRINLARAKAVTVRNVCLVCYAFICVASLGVLAFSTYTSQYVHIHFEAIYLAALGGCAINQCAQKRIRRTHSHTSVASEKKTSAYVVPIK